MKKGFILIDANNIGFSAVAGSRKSGQKVLRVGNQETGGVFHFLRSIHAISERLPILKPVALWDGVSWRKKEFEGYKANREAAPANKNQELLAEHRAAFKAQRPYMEKALQHLGVTQMKALNLEADDLGGMMVRRYEGKTILLLTGDKDWIQLVAPKVTWFDPSRDLRISPNNIKEKLGVDTPQQWLEVKALQGDTSDEIPGVGGIGEKGAIELVMQFGSMAEFFNRAIDGTLPKLPKKFMDLADQEDKQAIFRRNMRLMDLRSAIAPPPVNLIVDKGAFDKAKFDNLCRRMLFQSILTDASWCLPFSPVEMEKAA